MIQIILYWTYISLLFFILGLSTNKLTKRYLSISLFEKDSDFFKVILVGITSLLFILSIIHFFVPIDSIIHFAIVAILIIDLLLSRYFYKTTFTGLILNKEPRNNSTYILFSMVIISIAYISTDMPFYNFDEGRYHFQALLWSKEYKIIPGLANLHDRLGSNSSWYLLNAFFDCWSFEKKVFHIINPLMVLYLILLSINNLFTKKGFVKIISATILVYLFVSFSFIRYWYMIGVTPDVGVQFFIIAFTLYIYEIIDLDKKNDSASNIFFGILLTAGAIMSRATGVFMLLTFGLILIDYSSQKKNFIKIFLFIIPFALVTILRNLVLSGYLLFPSISSPFPLYWEFPKSFAAKLADYSTNHELYEFLTIHKQYSSQFDFERISDLINMFIAKNILNIGPFSSLFFSIAILPFLFIISKNKKHLWVALIIISIGIVSYIFTGGVYRFGLGYSLMATVIPLSLFIYSFQDRIHLFLSSQKHYKQILFSFILIFFIYKVIIPNSPLSLRKESISYPISLIKKFKTNIWYLKECPKSNTEEESINGIKIIFSNYAIYDKARLPNWFSYIDESCIISEKVITYSGYSTCEELNAFVSKMNWMNPLPCVGAVYEGVVPRGKNLQDGFMFSKK